jgi:hypothetical protein
MFFIQNLATEFFSRKKHNPYNDILSSFEKNTCNSHLKYRMIFFYKFLMKYPK